MRNKMNTYKICRRCIMDTSDPDIDFGDDDFCNYCTDYLKTTIGLSSCETTLNNLIKAIKENGVDKKYDCIIGVSGGVDSTYVAYMVKKFGLRPLAVHLDNGWNSELAVSNIEKTLDKLKIDLFTYVLDWEEFKNLQKSFLKASIPGMEIPTDHAILALLYKVAAQHKVEYIINGSNTRTEKIMPPSWSEAVAQRDWLLIKNIYKIYKNKKLKDFVRFSLIDYIKYKIFYKQKIINLIDFTTFSKKEAVTLIEKELGWRNYGGKHYESIYTRFTQGYIQPVKFNFDKRRAHLSNLICAGEISRAEALNEIEKSPYINRQMEEEDIEYFKKKLDLTDEEFDEILQAHKKSYKEYKGYFNHPLYKRLHAFALALHFYLKKINFYGSGT